jgi:4-hydroxy-tetrahydrodipicolinate synthase
VKDIRAASDLTGLWSAIPMPWDRDGKLDVGVLERNVARLAAVPCDGIYTTDSDGEFYALELAEFRDFVATFTRLMAATDCGIQIGVTWTNTTGIIDRIKVCLDHGVSTVHICYPYWMPLNQDDVKRFWHDLADAAPAARWIHYNTPRGHVAMRGDDYRSLAAEFPQQFIGTKLGTQSFVELSEIIGRTPNLAHFLTDFTIVPGIMLGGKGVYSFWVNTLPDWHRRLLDLCLHGKWNSAMVMQRKFNCWESECVEPLVRKGYLHGIVGKARCAASGFLEDQGYTRSPYQPVPPESVRALAAGFTRWWGDELAQESFVRANSSSERR